MEVFLTLTNDNSFSIGMVGDGLNLSMQTDDTVLEATLIPIMQGPPGAAGPAPFVFNSALSQWVVNHNLGRNVMSKVYSLGGTEVLAEITNVTINQVVVNFDQPQAGYLIVV